MMSVFYSSDHLGRGFEIQRTDRNEWTVFKSTGEKCMSFPSEEAAKQWIRAAVRDSNKQLQMSADHVAGALLATIAKMEHIWREAPQSFVGIHVLADVMNRLRDLAVECRKQIHNSRTNHK